MKDMGLDWGQLIAYLIPGFVTVGAIALCDDSMFTLLNSGLYGKESSGAIIAILLFALAAGMIVSVVRATFLDPTFSLSEKRFAFLYWRTSVGPMARHKPKIAAITGAGLLPALHEARSQDKRPYQFYGNLLLSVLLLAPAWAAGIQAKHASVPTLMNKVFYVALFLLVVPALYSAARTSHFRYMSEVIHLNRIVKESSKLTDGA